MCSSFWNTLRSCYAQNKFLSHHFIAVINFAVRKDVCLRCYNFQMLFKSLNILKSSFLYWISLWRFDAAKTSCFIKPISLSVGTNFPCLLYSSFTYSPYWCLSFPRAVSFQFIRDAGFWLDYHDQLGLYLVLKTFLAFGLFFIWTQRQCIGGNSQW